MNKKNLFSWDMAAASNYAVIKVNFYLKNYTYKNGTRQVIMQLTGEGVRKRIYLNVFTAPRDWDRNKQRVNHNAPNAADLNLVLNHAYSRITEIQVRYRLSLATLTVERLAHEFQNDTPQLNFVAFALHHINERPIAPSSKRKERNHINKLKLFKDSVLFTDLNIQFLDRYRNFLFKRGNSRNTINSNFKTICKYINLAKKYGIRIDIETDQVETKNLRSNRTFLNLEEVAKLKEYYFSSFCAKHHRLPLGYFLFACYTGCRLSEVILLNRDFNGDVITYFAPKTKKMMRIRLNKSARSIINHNPELFIRFISEQKINVYIKQCCAVVGVTKDISFHCSRHSFATNFLRIGGKVEELQVLLGHESIKTTMIYVHLLESESIESIMLFDKY
ncbi:MAG: site-specific integrase [Weeksellaceae bacterium]|nr:site-specific integrase [Weeksellaceae bacterium]